MSHHNKIILCYQLILSSFSKLCFFIVFKFKFSVLLSFFNFFNFQSIIFVTIVLCPVKPFQQQILKFTVLPHPTCNLQVSQNIYFLVRGQGGGRLQIKAMKISLHEQFRMIAWAYILQSGPWTILSKRPPNQRWHSPNSSAPALHKNFRQYLP